MLQIVFSTNGLAKVLATNNGPVRIYPTTAGSEWPVPNEKFVLWSTRPENAAWIELAKNAEAIVYWNAADANVNVLDEVLRAKLVTIADHTGSDELGTLLGTHPPNARGVLRERGVYANLDALWFPADLSAATDLPHVPDLAARVRATYDTLIPVGHAEFARILEKCPTIRAYSPTPGILVAQNTGHPVMLTARLLLLSREGCVVVQVLPNGRINVQTDGGTRLDAADYFVPGNGGGAPSNMGGLPAHKYDFDGAGEIDLIEPFNKLRE